MSLLVCAGDSIRDFSRRLFSAHRLRAAGQQSPAEDGTGRWLAELSSVVAVDAREDDLNNLAGRCVLTDSLITSVHGIGAGQQEVHK